MKFLVANTRFALGLAILENVQDMPAEIVALEPEEILEAEPKLLQKARGLMGRLPFDQIDVLVVGELGKNYSGSGMDPNVIGRMLVETMPDLPRPVVTRLAVLDASEETHGNIVGVGFADLTTELLVSKLDPEPFRINVLTSCWPGAGQNPDHPADRPRSPRRGVRHLLEDRPARIPGGDHPQYPGADHPLGLAGARGRSGLGPPPASARPSISRCRSRPPGRSTRNRCSPRASGAAGPSGPIPRIETPCYFRNPPLPLGRCSVSPRTPGHHPRPP